MTVARDVLDAQLGAGDACLPLRKLPSGRETGYNTVIHIICGYLSDCLRGRSPGSCERMKQKVVFEEIIFETKTGL